MSENYVDMSPEEFQDLVEDFLVESEKHLRILNEKLLQAEDSLKSGNKMSSEDLNAMFRAAHTIKGTASFIKLKKIESLTHEMETILQRLKEGKMELTIEIVDVLFRAFDTLESLLESLKEKGVEEGEIEENVSEIKSILNGEKQAKEEEKEPQEFQLQTEKYLKQFLVEGYEYLESFNNTLMNLEENKDNTGLVNELFRLIHTIKGSCGVVDAYDIQKVTHSMENLLVLMRDGKIKPDDNNISILFEGADIVKSLFDALKNNEKSDKDIDLYCIRIEAILSDFKTEKKEAPKGQKKDEKEKRAEGKNIVGLITEKAKDLIDSEISFGNAVYAIAFSIIGNIKAKDMKLLLVEEKLSKKGKIIYEEPNSMELAENEPSGDVRVLIAFSTKEKMQDVKSFLSADGIEDIIVEKIGSAELSDVPDDKPDKKGEAVLRDKNEHEKGIPKKSSEQNTDKKSAPIEISTIRVDSNKIDHLMNLSGELVITRARFSQILSQFGSFYDSQREISYILDDLVMLSKELRKNVKFFLSKYESDASLIKIGKIVEEVDKTVSVLNEKMHSIGNANIVNALDEVTGSLGKIASDIQSGVMQTRMIPVEGIFSRFKRVVRDISKKLGKSVVLKIEGEDTELDKKIVDSLSEPLTHMIRNAVDHGIEDAETRKAKGKPAEGTIFLRAYHKGNSFCVEVSDDGKGLDAEKIAESAIKKGIVSPEQVEKMNEKEKLNLIFMPGFSTAEKVTGISGRGVGMDVVKNMINAVNGIIEINTEVGVGTTFILKIPLTLAIIQALLVEAGGKIYAFPFDTVVEIVKVSDNEVYSIDGNTTIKLRGHALSIVNFEKIFGIKSNGKNENSLRRVVVVTNGIKQLGIEVDNLIGGEEIVIKSLTEHFSKVSGIMGASILGDGRIALIIDPFSVIKYILQ